jgi:hypothetical protein
VIQFRNHARVSRLAAGLLGHMCQRSTACMRTGLRLLELLELPGLAFTANP